MHHQQEISELWQTGTAPLPNQLNCSLRVYLNRTRAHILDIVVCAFAPLPQKVSFFQAENYEPGRYFVANTGFAHSDLAHGDGLGIAVHPVWRQKGIGKATLSLGIAMAQKHWREQGSPGNFLLWGKNPPDKKARRMYESAGFDIVHLGGRGETWVLYANSESAPDFEIAERTRNRQKALLSWFA